MVIDMNEKYLKIYKAKMKRHLKKNNKELMTSESSKATKRHAGEVL